MTPYEVREGLADALKSISGVAVSLYRAPNIQAPHAVIGLPSVEYDVTMGRGSDTLNVQVLLYVTRADDQLAQANVDEYMAGHGDRSIKTALEDPALSGLSAAMVRVQRAEAGTASSQDGSEWLAATFDVQVIASGIA